MSVSRRWHNGCLGKLKAMIAFYAAEAVQYRAELVIYLLCGLEPLIMMFIWVVLAESGALDGSYSSSQFIAYFLLIYLVRQFNPVWFPWLLDEDIRLGRLSFKLLRPVHPYWVYLAYQLGDSCIRIPIVVPVVLLGLWISGAHTAVSLHGALAAIPALLGGVVIGFHLNLIFGLTAFWIERSLAFMRLYYTLLLILGGALVPLDLFPPTVARIIEMTPFPYILGFPVEAALGALEDGELAFGLGVQTAWMVLTGVMALLLWRAGLRGYVAAGA